MMESKNLLIILYDLEYMPDLNCVLVLERVPDLRIHSMHWFFFQYEGIVLEHSFPRNDAQP